MGQYTEESEVLSVEEMESRRDRVCASAGGAGKLMRGSRSYEKFCTPTSRERAVLWSPGLAAEPPAVLSSNVPRELGRMD